MLKVTKLLSIVVLITSVGLGAGLEQIKSRAQTATPAHNPQLESFIIPAFELETFDGQVMTDRELADVPTLLTFVLPNCPACENAIPMISSLVDREPDVQYLFVTKGKNPELLSYFGSDASSQFPILIDADLSLAHLFAANRAPLTFLIQNGVVLRRIDWPIAWAELLSLLSALREGSLEALSPAAVRAGQGAPGFSAQTVGGKAVSLAEISKPLLIVFYSELCIPSMQFLMELSDTRGTFANLEILLIASSTVTDFDREFNIIEDRDLGLFELYGIQGTPTSILVDEEETVTLVHIGFRSDFVEVIKAALSND